MNKRTLVLGLCALYLLGFVAWCLNGALHGDSWALPILLGGVLVFATSACFKLKKMFIAAYGPIHTRPAPLDEFPRLNKAELEHLTREWEALGFEQRGDRARDEATPRTGAVFSRVFEHTEEGAVLELWQHFAPLQTLPWTAGVTSCWGEREPVSQLAQQLENAARVAPLSSPSAPEQPLQLEVSEPSMWVFITHNRAPNRFYSLMRQKRLLSLRLERGTAPKAMWQAHLERRDLLESRVGEPHLSGNLSSLVEAHGQIVRVLVLRRLRRTPAWKFGRAFVSRAPILAQYDGELPA